MRRRSSTFLALQPAAAARATRRSRTSSPVGAARWTSRSAKRRLHQGSGKSRQPVFQRPALPPGDAAAPGLDHRACCATPAGSSRFECPLGPASRSGWRIRRSTRPSPCFGSDQVEAREILTPSFMQQLVDLESSYSAGQHSAARSVESELLIALECGDRFEIGNMFSSLVERVAGRGHRPQPRAGLQADRRVPGRMTRR